MPSRKVQLVKGEMYHIYSKSIADFKIFTSETDYTRMQDEFTFYSSVKPACNFSSFQALKKDCSFHAKQQINCKDKLVDIIAYCIMPSHIHLILKEIREDGIAKFMESILKSYSRYFNIKHNRKGPLWESRFNNILVKDHEQFIHLTRYIHLNPVTAYIVNNPVDWNYSSYREYIGLIRPEEKICHFSDYLNMDLKSYREFVTAQIEYQRELGALKRITTS
jgi:putative transposase